MKSEMLTEILLVLLFIISTYFYFYLKYNNNYWKRRGVKYVKPYPIVGNILSYILGKQSLSELIKSWYNTFPGERVIGIFQFTTPILMIRDPELIKSVAIQKFEHFQDHSPLMTLETSDPLWERSLFASRGNRWRDLRQTLSPVFTSSKMKSMFVLMLECAQKLNTHLKANSEHIELKDLCSRFANDVFATTLFGIECNSFKQPNNEVLLNGKELADFSGIKRIIFLIVGKLPRLAQIFSIRLISKKVATFFRKIVDDTIESREKNNIVRPDLMHLLMLSRKGKLRLEETTSLETGFAAVQESNFGSRSSNNYLTNEDITAQATIFYLGGFDTTSSIMSFACYELGINPSIQDKLREEILNAHRDSNGKINYEKITQMKYLDMVISETLRKWPQGTWLDRKCTKSFTIEPENVQIDEGQICWIPAFAIQRDPEYFPEPDVFDPERFNEENIGNIESGTYIPFGFGPRNCIGSRFALLEIKVFLYFLLLDFKFVPTDAAKTPFKITAKSTMMIPENGFPITLKRITCQE